jgi:hypothetical protein
VLQQLSDRESEQLSEKESESSKSDPETEFQNITALSEEELN